MGQWVHKRRVHREHGVEQMGEPYALPLGDQPEQGSVTVKAPRAPRCKQFQARFVVTVEDLLCNTAGRITIGERQGV